jgi:hypothetical protein
MYDSKENIENGSGGEWIAENLCPCDNVVVPTATNEPFWLMLLDKSAHVVVTSFKDVDGNEWIKGDIIVRGFWYQQLRPRNHSYTLYDDKHVAFVFSHLILASKKFMLPSLHVVEGNYATYELTNDVEEVILEALDVFKLLD